jgi:predicted NBD/HSP70 family sugar kinase
LKCVFDAERAKAQLAVWIVNEIAFYLGFALSNVAYMLNP